MLKQIIFLYKKKNEFYQQNLQKDNKLNEYREKIKLLKMKINELSNVDNNINHRLNTFNSTSSSNRDNIRYYSNTFNPSRKFNYSLNKYNNNNSSFNLDLNKDYNKVDFNRNLKTYGRLSNNFI